MTPLESDIRAMIAQDGPMPLERYMALALGHPRHGYYMTRDPFGASGDFITAPEISQMFGELIGLWAAQVWMSMGAPSSLRLIELGPGRGALMADALRAGAAAKGFREALRIELVEMSPVLRRRQAAALAGIGLPVEWRARVEDVPDGPAIVIANEFFDALPVRHYVRDATGWRERCVGLAADGRLGFGLAPTMESAIDIDAPPGAVLEISPASRAVATHLAARLAAGGGAALVIDYGHLRPALGETLQAVRAHRHVDPLADAGEADLTAHVDFAALGRAAAAAGARLAPPVTQGVFLRRLGIAQRAERLARDADAATRRDIAAALERLAGFGKGSMGDLFKAMSFHHPDLPTPPGFEGEAA